MNNKSFIQRLAQTTGYTQDDCQKMVYSMVDAMNQRFQEGENVLLPGFGTFEVKKRMERIIINPNTRQRLLVPPKLVLGFRPTASVRKVLKDGKSEFVESGRTRKGEMSGIVGYLVEKHGLTVNDAETFFNQFVNVLNEGLLQDRLVKVKGLGTFKVVDVKERVSVDVNTGERIVIDGRSKITFLPDSVMKDLVNKPFSQFDTVVLNEGVTFDDIEEVNTDEESETIETEDEPQQTEELNPILEETLVVDEKPIIEDTPVEEEPILGETSIEESSIEEEEPIVGETSIEKSSIEEEEPIVEVTIHEESLVEEPTPEMTAAARIASPIESIKQAPIESEETPTMNNEQNELNKHNERQRTPWCPYVLTALIAAAIGFGAGWIVRGIVPTSEKVGPQAVAPIVEDSTAVVDTLDEAQKAAEQALRDSLEQVRRDSIEVARRDSLEKVRRDSLEKVQRDLERVKKELEAQKEAEAKAKQEAQKKAEQQATQAAASNNPSLASARRQVELGAYRIVGTQETITVKEGQTMERLSKFYFGEGMECYLQVHNGTAVVKPGMKLKIPKLEIKKKR